MSASRAFLKVLLPALVLTVSTLFFLYQYSHREPKLGGDFTLKSEAGDWTLSQHPKPLTVLYVGYVECPDVCPMTLSHAASAFRKLTPADLGRVQLVFLSVDHEHDTAKDVATYAKQFFPDFIGLTGTEPQIRTTVNKFGASFMLEKDAGSYLGYSIAHTDRLFLLDSNGFVIDSISSPRDSAPIVEQIKEHI